MVTVREMILRFSAIFGKRRRAFAVSFVVSVLVLAAVTVWPPLSTSYKVLQQQSVPSSHELPVNAADQPQTNAPNEHRTVLPVPKKNNLFQHKQELHEGHKHENPSVHAPAVYTIPSERLFRERELIVWNVDHHPAPGLDIRSFLEPMGVRYLQFDLSDYCYHFNLCKERQYLKVLNRDNMFELNETLIPKFYEAYRDDPLFQSVDAFICTDPPATCELYEQFNRSMIIIAGNRYHIGRDSITTLERWKLWNKRLKRFAADPKHFIGANNQYDVNFMRYFTGLTPQYIQSYSGYTNVKYEPTIRKYLVAKRRVNQGQITLDWLVSSYNDACLLRKSLNKPSCPELQRLDQISFGQYDYSGVASYQGVIHLPYQVSTMSIFEQYRMNMPLFFPSKRMLDELDPVHWVVNERTMPWLVHDPLTLPPHPSQRHLPNPNDQHNSTAIRYWLQFADYYTLPHIQYYDSVEHLAELLSDLTVHQLMNISRQMKTYNKNLKVENIKKWKAIMLNAAKYSPNRPH